MTCFSFRKFVDGVFRFFLVGIVTGNPSSCFDKNLPDIYNFVGNKQVSWEFWAITGQMNKTFLDSWMDKKWKKFSDYYNRATGDAAPVVALVAMLKIMRWRCPSKNQ